MSQPTLNLIVIRTPNVAESVAFYTGLGLKFTAHQHGTGTPHHASEGSVTLEIYPTSANQPPTKQLRLGFQVASMATVLFNLPPTCILTQPKDSEWGLRAIVQDPDGHKVELIQTTKP
jgi:catechol 2,3-dioxygenase-like lactoylglutathione lyase family enzyme